MIIVGWCDTYISQYPTAEFSETRRMALIDIIQKRKYNYNFSDYEFLSYCCPLYEDSKICVLTKQQFDDVMSEAWKDIPRSGRLMPADIISLQPVNGVLYEKEKYIPKESVQNG